MGVRNLTAESREDDGSDGSSESIRLQERHAFDRPSSNKLSKPRYPEQMQQQNTRGSFAHRWRQSSSSDLHLGSPPLTPGTVTPMSLVTPSATWLPDNRNSSMSALPTQFATPLVCHHLAPLPIEALLTNSLLLSEKPRILMAFIPRSPPRHPQERLDKRRLNSSAANTR